MTVVMAIIHIHSGIHLLPTGLFTVDIIIIENVWLVYVIM